MQWHVRHNHTVKTAEKPDDRTKLRCPVEDCLKSYKMKGWLVRHMKQWHPMVKVDLDEKGMETKRMAAETKNKKKTKEKQQRKLNRRKR